MTLGNPVIKPADNTVSRSKGRAATSKRVGSSMTRSGVVRPTSAWTDARLNSSGQLILYVEFIHQGPDLRKILRQPYDNLRNFVYDVRQH